MALRLVKDSEVNKVSGEIKEYLKERALKPGQTAKYRLLGGTRNTDPQKHDGIVLYPACVTIRLTDKIYDKEKGEPVTIGVIQELGRAGDIVFAQLMVFPNKNDPYFFLSGDKVDDIEKYELLELISTNKSSPYRSVDVDPIFERVDETLESQVRSKRRNILRDSLNAIQGWTYDEIRIIGSAYNIPSTLSHDIIKDKLETIAERDPITFYKTIDSEDTKIKAVISLAKEQGIISYIGHEHKWIMTGSAETLAILTRVEGASETEQFAQVLLSGANGPKMRGNIEKLLKAKK